MHYINIGVDVLKFYFYIITVGRIDIYYYVRRSWQRLLVTPIQQGNREYWMTMIDRGDQDAPWPYFSFPCKRKNPV